MSVWAGFSSFRIGSSGSCEHGILYSGSIKGGALLNQLNYYQLPKKDPAPRVTSGFNVNMNYS